MKTIELFNNEYKRFSQFGEDGITVEIIRNIGDSNRYYVEIGAYPNECNSKVLKVDWGWRGIALDREPSFCNPADALFTEEITPFNINEIFRKYRIIDNPAFMSIDVDGLDFHLWNNMLSQFDPNIMCIEVNTHHLWNVDEVMPISEFYTWDYTDYFGASLMAMNRLAESRGYVLVYVTSEGVNAFFVKKSKIPIDIQFFNQGNVEKLYRSIKEPPVGGHPPDRNNRQYHLSSTYMQR
jgi:hypothetical protein